MVCCFDSLRIIQRNDWGGTDNDVNVVRYLWHLEYFVSLVQTSYSGSSGSYTSIHAINQTTAKRKRKECRGEKESSTNALQVLACYH